MTENERLTYKGTPQMTEDGMITPVYCDYPVREIINRLAEFEAIGTVEEFKAFRSDDFTEHLLNMGYTKGIKDGYNKAIDEFAEKLNTDVESFVAEVDGVRADLLTLDYFSEFVFEVAEQLKGVQ